jgi:hypothetical protein
MEGQVILSSIPLEQLEHLLTSIVRKEIREKDLEDLNEKLLSPEETCKLFAPCISRPTLESYVRKGVFIKYNLGGRCWFKYSEIMAALKTLKRYQRS